MADSIFLDSKITSDDDCNATMKLKDVFSLEEKLLTNLDSILKSRDITLLTKAHIVKAMVFPVMYGCESCTIKMAAKELMVLNCGVGEDF